MRNLILVLLISFYQIQAQSLRINEYMASNSSVIQDENDDYSDWIEIYNPTSTSINMLNFAISDDLDNPRKWIFPNIDIAANSFLLVFASDKDKTDGELHTNFKISADGEELILTDNEGQIINQLDATPMGINISLGRSITDPSQWLFFTTSTPGGPNNTEGFTAFSENPTFSVNGGFYSGSIALELSTGSGSNEVYFTTDGSDPTKSSTHYIEPIIISSTKVIRARVFETDLLPSRIITHTYFLNESTSLPIISLSTNPDNFWHDEIGIYVVGTNGIIGECGGEIANYNQEWERPVHIEFFEDNKTLAFSIDAGVAIHGGCTRSFPQKSLSITARGEYGANKIPYKIFPNLPYDEYESILLRSSGNDNYSTMIRDALMQGLVENLDIETQAYRPSVVFINGEYFGIHNIRERHHKDYIIQHHNLENQNIDLLFNRNYIKEGSNNHYNNMYDFINTNDLSIKANYDYVNTQMQINNYTIYLLSEMYFVNRDWYPNNTKFWRHQTPEGKWRWILYDTDYGFGIGSMETINYNMINYIQNDSRYPSVLINGLLTNDSYKNKFITTFADLYNSVFKPDDVVARIDSYKTIIQLEMPRHIGRWGNISSYTKWSNNIDDLKYFANNRLSIMTEHFIDEFNLQSLVDVNLSVNNSGYENIQLNTLNISLFPWGGKYFNGVPVTLEALPKSGYRFIGWTGDIVSSENIITYIPSTNISIVANFEEINAADLPNIVINEINYHGGDLDPGDWLEIYNNTNSNVDITNWIFKDDDDDHIFTVPEGTILESNSYLVLCNNLTDFTNAFPNIQNVIGELGFGFSGSGDQLRLYHSSQILIDSLEYTDDLPWPTEPDGEGPTLELKHPDLENSLGENWSASLNELGTPGEANSALQSKTAYIIKIFLEGAYSGSNSMNSGIGQNSSLPLNQPFNVAPWFYEGNEKLLELPNEEIADWVLVELREEINSETSIAKKAALLKNNGSVVDLDGESDLAFYNLDPGDCYIVIHHRNHLSVMSSEKATLNEVE